MAELRERTAHVARGGGERAGERYRSRGKLTARERIDRLVDPGSAFLGLNALAAWEQVRHSDVSSTRLPARPRPLVRRVPPTVVVVVGNNGLALLVELAKFGCVATSSLLVREIVNVSRSISLTAQACTACLCFRPINDRPVSTRMHVRPKLAFPTLPIRSPFRSTTSNPGCRRQQTISAEALARRPGRGPSGGLLGAEVQAAA